MEQLKKFQPVKGKYPWNKWANGRPWRVIHGKDFDCTIEGFRSAIYQYGRRANRGVRVAVKGSAVEFQFGKGGK